MLNITFVNTVTHYSAFKKSLIVLACAFANMGTWSMSILITIFSNACNKMLFKVNVYTAKEMTVSF